jgi:hypothetical protein
MRRCWLPSPCSPWSGYASAKWSTEFRLLLAQASTARAEANRATGIDAEARRFDSSTFDAWFTAYVAGNRDAMDVAEHRFRPELPVALDAWMRLIRSPTTTRRPDPPTCPSTSGLNSPGRKSSTPRPTPSSPRAQMLPRPPIATCG